MMEDASMFTTTTELAGRTLEFNKAGYLVSFDDWDREIAQALASQEGLALTERHWKVIEFLRAYYRIHEIPPSPRVIIQAIGQELSVYGPYTRKHLEALFLNGGCKQACRIAGLPRAYCQFC